MMTIPHTKGRQMISEKETGKEGSASSLVRGLLVLEAFGPNKHGYTLSELTRKLGMPKSSIYRVLKTLSEMDYLRYEEHSKRYQLGVRVLSLGFALLNNMELREIARPYMESLSRECNKTVNLAVLDRDEMVYVERIGVRGIRSYSNISIGSRIPPWKSAIGKAVLAYLEPQKLAEMMDKAKENMKCELNENEFRKILLETRNNGFAIDNQETRKGILAIGAPLFSPQGVTSAINLVAEPEDISIEKLKSEFAPKLIKVARQLSEALGYQSPERNS